VQYGPRLAAVVLYLLHFQLLPEKRLAALLADLFGVHLACATIARISQGAARRVQGFIPRKMPTTTVCEHLLELKLR